MPFGVVAVHPLSDTMDLSIALPTERDRKSMYLERYLCFWKPSPRRQWRGTDYLKPLHRYCMSSLRCLELSFEIKETIWYDASKIYQEQPLLVWEIMRDFSPGSTSWTEGTQTENMLEGRSEGKHKCSLSRTGVFCTRRAWFTLTNYHMGASNVVVLSLIKVPQCQTHTRSGFIALFVS